MTDRVQQSPHRLKLAPTPVARLSMARSAIRKCAMSVGWSTDEVLWNLELRLQKLYEIGFCRGLVPRVSWATGYGAKIWIRLAPSSSK
jgi:hypothetical protein